MFKRQSLILFIPLFIAVLSEDVRLEAKEYSGARIAPTIHKIPKPILPQPSLIRPIYNTYHPHYSTPSPVSPTTTEEPIPTTTLEPITEPTRPVIVPNYEPATPRPLLPSPSPATTIIYEPATLPSTPEPYKPGPFIIPTFITLPTTEATSPDHTSSLTSKAPYLKPYPTWNVGKNSCDDINGYYSVNGICDSFMECRNYNYLEFICPEGLYFNPKALWPNYPCAYPSEVQCTEHPIPTTEATSPVPIPEPIIHPTTSSEKPPYRPDTIIEVNYYCENLNEYYAKKNKCEFYFECKNHKIVERSCPVGLHFDAKLLFPNYPCSAPSTAQCHYYSPSHAEFPNHSSSLTSKAPHLKPYPTWNVGKNSCDDINGYYSVNGLCDSFMECRNYNYLEFICPEGLYFNPSALWPNYPCAYPSEVHCTKSPIPVPTPKPTPTKPPVLKPYPTFNVSDSYCDRSNGYYQIENQCDSFVECRNHKYFEYLCPEGLYFNPKALWPEYACSYPSEVQCSSKLLQPSKATSECPHQYGYFPSEDSDCSRYISCQEGKATYMICPAGLVFNPALSACDWPENVPHCKPDVFRDFVCPKPPLDEHGKASDILLNYRYDNSCIQYVACHLGQPRLLSCDPGFAFDESSGRCVNDEDVKNCSRI